MLRKILEWADLADVVVCVTTPVHLCPCSRAVSKVATRAERLAQTLVWWTQVRYQPPRLLQMPYYLGLVLLCDATLEMHPDESMGLTTWSLRIGIRGGRCYAD